MHRAVIAALSLILLFAWQPGIAQAASAATSTDSDGPPTTTSHLWILERLRLSGAVDKGAIAFELEGQLLQKGSHDVPLFGPATKIRLEGVTENGGRASVGFESDHYYLHTGSPRFVLRGTLVLPDDRTVTVVGPLNALDADLHEGRLTEGAHLAALTGVNIHFDAESGGAPAQPPVFSIARALRVGKETAFEYKLIARSGTDLGVVRLPLRYGERVVDVVGSVGWRVEGDELLLPTTGTGADVTISGTVAKVASATSDPRSPFEWWLLESDAEHRVIAGGDARQHDPSESPIAPHELNSRLFLVQRGQHLDITVQTLQSLEVLAATVRSHSRELVLTSAGDLVEQDEISYDDSGLDYLHFTPNGTPLFLATDDASERVMHGEGSEDMLIPMRHGPHTVMVQSLSHASIGVLAGRLALPAARLPLASGREQLSVGLPGSVHPLVVTGGDSMWCQLSLRDLVALVLAGAVSALALRTHRSRSLGFVALAGLWMISQVAFAAVLAATAVALGVAAVTCQRTMLSRALAGACVAAGLVGALLVLALAPGADQDAAPTPEARAKADEADARIARQAALREAAEFGMIGSVGKDRGGRGEGIGIAISDNNRAGQGLSGGSEPHGQVSYGAVIDGVRPVALTMPSYVHAAAVSRQLVTPTRPFVPTLYYVTDGGLALLGLSWLGCVVALLAAERARLRALRDRLHVLLAPPAVAPAIAVPAE